MVVDVMLITITLRKMLHKKQITLVRRRQIFRDVMAMNNVLFTDH